MPSVPGFRLHIAPQASVTPRSGVDSRIIGLLTFIPIRYTSPEIWYPCSDQPASVGLSSTSDAAIAMRSRTASNSTSSRP